MNEFTNISLAGVSFKLENDAYQILEAYLAEFVSHYNKEKGGGEIISDIEERIAELFIERKGRDGIISGKDMNEVIEILGHPSEIEDGQTSGERSGRPYVKRRLYRDPSDRIIGGVLSGFGNYLKVEPVFTRLIYALISFSLFLWADGVWAWSPILLYFLLIIIMPAAKSVKQRCAMLGLTSGIEDIRSSNEIKGDGIRSTIGGFLQAAGRSLQIIVGIVFIALGVCGLILIPAVFFGMEISHGIPFIDVIDYIRIGVSAWVVKSLVIVTHLLLCLLLLYWGIKCCFMFKSPKWRPGLILFIAFMLMAISSTAVGLFAARHFTNYRDGGFIDHLATKSDTLYIKFNNLPLSDITAVDLKESLRYYRLFYVRRIEESGQNMEIVKYPAISICRDETDKGEKMIKERYAYPKGAVLLGNNVAKREKCYSVTDSLITINPQIYSKERKYDGIERKIYLYIPEGCVVKPLDENIPERRGRFGLPEED